MKDDAYILGILVIAMAIFLLITKIRSLYNKKLYEKMKDSPFGEVGIWVFIAGLILSGVKLISEEICAQL